MEALAKAFRLNSVPREMTSFSFFFFSLPGFFFFLEGGEKHTLLAVS